VAAGVIASRLIWIEGRVYLVDTNVVSELRRLRPHGAVLAWLDAVPEQHLHLSAVTLGELQIGIERTRARDPERASMLEAWIDSIAGSWHIVPMDGPMFRLWARLMHRRSRELSEDAMIAATAIVLGLAVATRNVRDFAPFEVSTFNPFTYG
jgi:predicted nucleic acid-binding protein